MGHAVFMRLQFATRAYISGIFNIPGFKLDFVQADLMHCVDLGMTQYFLANLLLEVFVFMNGLWTRPEEVLATIVLFVKTASKNLGMAKPAINRLTMNMIKAPKSTTPKLKTKAAEGRHLVAALVFVLEHILPPQNDFERTRLQCAKHLNQIYDDWRNWHDGSADAMARHVRAHCILYSDLQIQALLEPQRSWIRYRLYPKHHLTVHIAEEQAKIQNPMESWCYADESAIGHYTDIAESLHASTLHKGVVQKGRLADFRPVAC